MARSDDPIDDPRTKLDATPAPGDVAGVLTARLHAPDTELSASPNSAMLSIPHLEDRTGEPLVELSAPTLNAAHDAGGVSRNVVVTVRPARGESAEMELYLPAEVWTALNRTYYGSDFKSLEEQVARFLGQ